MSMKSKYIRAVAQSCSAALVLCCMLAGCTQTQVTTVVKDIGIYAQQAEPILVALLPIITAFSSTSQDAKSAAALNTFAATATSDLQALTGLCTDYAANPSASVYSQVESTVDKLVSESDASMLQVLAIKDPQTRQRVQLGMASFDALIHTIDGFVQTTQTAGTIAAKAQSRTIKLQQVAAFWSKQDQHTIADAFHTNYDRLIKSEAAMGF